MTRDGGRVLPDAFFARPAPEVARDLLGAVLVSRVRGVLTAARIVEVEAYLGREDPASHAYRGRLHTGNRHLYDRPGTWYVYRSYGVHWCANLVTGPDGLGAAVLLRGLAPLEGLPAMRRRRHGADGRRLCDGPGKLCQALGVTRALDGMRMRASPVIVVSGSPAPDGSVRTTPRVGITRAANWPLRFVAAQ